MGLKHLLLSSSLLCGLVLPVVVQAADVLAPRAEVSVKGGSERSMLTTEFWAPLAQKSDRVIYADARLMGDNDDNREGNLGVGYRQIYKPTNSVLGIHGWIDRRRTERNHNFHQLTFGVESLGDKIDLRANGYVPLNGAKTITTPNTGSVVPYLAGTGIFYDTNGSISETPQYGFDAEAGYRLPMFEKHIDALRVFGGGYHFFRNSTDNVTGFRIRAEAQINRLVSVGARFQHDGPRGSQGFLEATLRFPFSAKKLYQSDKLRSRLDESPERDIDIVTGSKVDNGKMKPFINNDTNKAQRILYVDNNNIQAGDGSKENPFNDLLSAQTALQTGDILYIAHGDGTTRNMDQGLTITQSGISIIGSGSDLTFDGSKYHPRRAEQDFSGYTLLSATSAPVLTNTGGDGISVTADNTDISGLIISGTQASGIAFIVQNGTSYNDIRLSNLVLQNNILDGVTINAAASGSVIDTVRAENITTSGNLRHGLYVTANSGGTINNILLSDVKADANGNNGISLLTDNVGTMGNVTVQNSRANSNIGVGLRVQSDDAGSIIDQIYLSKIEANGNLTNSSSDGLAISATGNGLINEATISDIIANNNGSTGITVISNSGIINKAIFNNILTNGNISHGVNLRTQSSGVINQMDLQDIVTVGNTGEGVRIAAQSATSKIYNTSFTNVTSIGNRNGIYIYGNSGLMSNISVNNFTGSNNTQHGVYVQAEAGGRVDTLSLSGITANNNALNGIFLYAITSNATISGFNITNATAQSNLGNGVMLHGVNTGNVSNGTLSQVISLGNNSVGMYFYAQNSSVIMDNISVSNSDSIGNRGFGFYINDDTSFAYDIDFGGGKMGSIGRNRFFGNTGSDVRIDHDAAQIKAENNWWGNGSTPTRVTLDAGDTIDATPFLASDPRP